MTLTSDSRRTLHEALLSAFPDRNALARMLTFGLEVNLDELAGNAGLSTVVLDLIRWAEARGRVDELVAAAVKDNPGNRELQAFKRAWSAAERPRVPASRPVADSPVALSPSHASIRTVQPPAVGDPFSASLVRGLRPFLNRYRLREHLRRLASGASEILVVNGPPGSGKTYSTELIFHVAAALGSLRVVYINAGEEMDSPGFGPGRLARQVARHIASGDSGPAEGWPNGEIASWLLGVLTRGADRWWIVLDGIDRPGLPVETLDLVQRLMILASAAGVRGSFALVLLGFDLKLVPAELEPYVLQEVIEAPTVEDVAEFFLAVFRERNLAVAEHQVAEVVARVVQANAPFSMRTLSSSIKEHLDRL